MHDHFQKFGKIHLAKGIVQWHEAERAEGSSSSVINNEATKWMWGKQEFFILSDSLWVLISKGQDSMWQRKRLKLLNGNWLISDCFTTTWRGSCPFLPTGQSAPSFLLVHNYLNNEH